MRKLLQIAIAGLAAVSFSALAADKSTEVDTNTKIQGDAKAGSTDTGVNAGTGASADIKTDKKAGKKAKKDSKHDNTSGAGSTTAPMSKDQPAPAPAPEKKAD